MARLARFVSILALLSTTSAAAQDSPVRQPAAKWVVDFDAAQCVASRDYGTAGSPLTLALKAPPFGDVMQVAVIRPAAGAADARQLDASIGIDGGGTIATSMVAFTAPETGRRLFRMNLPLDQFAALSKAKTVRIQGEGELDERIALAQMEPLLRVLANCTADLRKAWNIGENGAAGTALKTRAAAEATTTEPQAFPVVAVNEEKSGTTRVAVLVDEAGRVADCAVIATSGVAALDAQSCWMIEGRTRFTPATGIDGKPARDAYMRSVVWDSE